MLVDVLNPRDINTHCAACGRSFARFPSDEEHIFPKWLQHHHDLWTRKLNVGNYTGKQYKSAKIKLCKRCNGTTYHALETLLAPLLTSDDPFGAVSVIGDDILATWLGKIMWLLVSKSRSAIDYRTRDEAQPDSILSADQVPGTLYLGMMQRAFATKKSMATCFLYEPRDPARLGRPFSLYRFKIDTEDERFETFDFSDSPSTLSLMFRSGNLGVVCIFDGGLHQRFQSGSYEYFADQLLHPQQFAELAARITYDQTVLDERACEVTYFWDEQLNSVIAMTRTPRFYYPYLQEHHDEERLVDIISRLTLVDPSQILRPEGVITTLLGSDGKFAKFPVTEAELAVARSDPDVFMMGELDADWRLTENGPQAKEGEE
tara:strand:+ start:9995 stop:11119 length:1125 start_codon:yes stop_codon:yes gene_type:complete